MVRQRSMRAANEPTGREVAVPLHRKLQPARGILRQPATSRPASRGEFAGMGGRAHRRKGWLDVNNHQKIRFAHSLI